MEKSLSTTPPSSETSVQKIKKGVHEMTPDELLSMYTIELCTTDETAEKIFQKSLAAKRIVERGKEIIVEMGIFLKKTDFSTPMFHVFSIEIKRGWMFLLSKIYEERKN